VSNWLDSADRGLPARNPHIVVGEPVVINPAKDTTKMSSTELREYAERLMQQAEEQSTKEFESTLNFLSDKLTHMGKTKKDAVIHLIKMMKSHEAEETLAELAEGAGFTSPRRAKERGDLDSEGNPPEIGVTYQLPTGETWTRKSKVGATKREFAAFAKTTTWGAMRV
jgi:hypothetical protein